MEDNCESNQGRSWGEQLAAVRLKTIVNLIERAVGESELGRAAGRRTMENNCKSNQTCSREEQLARRMMENNRKSNQTRSWGGQLAAVRWKTIVNPIKRAVGESSWPPYDGTQL